MRGWATAHIQLAWRQGGQEEKDTRRQSDKRTRPTAERDLVPPLWNSGTVQSFWQNRCGVGLVMTENRRTRDEYPR